MDAEYFINCTVISIIINPDNDISDNVISLIKCFESFDNDQNIAVLNEINRIYDIYFKNLSSGEQEFVEVFSNIYNALSRSKKSNLIVLDEPDKMFHPEWSRKFINALVKLVNSDAQRNKKFQFIISTHSPFMMSDVPGLFVTCLDKQSGDNGYFVSQRHLNNFFACNIYETLKNDFFVDSPIGEFATNKINEYMRRINNLGEMKRGSQSIERCDSTMSDRDISNEYLILFDEINLIGDKFIRSTLIKLLDEKSSKLSVHTNVDDEIEFLEKRLGRLKEMRDSIDTVK